MKRIVRFISLALSMIMLLVSMTSCLSLVKIAEQNRTTEATTQAIPGIETTTGLPTLENPEDTTAFSETNVTQDTTTQSGQTTATTKLPGTTTGNNGLVLPEVGLLEKYPYVLIEQDYIDYQTQLALCEELVLEGTDTEAIEQAWEELFEMYYYIATQSQISYIQYCTDTKDAIFKEQYLYATEVSTDAYTEYITVCQNIYNSESSYKDEFFSAWSQEEIDSMLATSPEIAECNKINDEILVAYRDLPTFTFKDESSKLFMQMVENNNRIAELNGYDNYIDYAYKEIYLRDYEPEKIAEMRELVKQYLIPMFTQTYNDLWEIYNSIGLSRPQQTAVDKILEGTYKDLDMASLEAFMDSLAPSSASGMKHMLENGNMIFINDKNAQGGAFTGYLYEHGTPICYFGPGYQSVFTIAHELGHYYAFVDNGESSLQMDFAELQSQGNEFMYLAFMGNQNDNRVWRTVIGNQMYSTLISIIICCMVDEFEQYVYTHADEITDPTTQLDEIMNNISKTYGNGMFNNFVDINNYWRMVVIESPVYYISYAVSGIMALDLYSIAKTNYEAAVEQYRALVEEVTEDDTLQSFLEIAGLGSPFDEETYQRISAA